MDWKASKTQYVISLDAIDLNYIPTVSKYNSYGVTQIWTKKNLNRHDTEYYEFEIMEEDENGVKSNCPGSTQKPCHICNIDIPKAFYRDHLNSEKHKMFKNIVNESLNRMKKVLSNELNDENDEEDTNVNNKMYFCGSCMTVVETSEKTLHNNSVRHRNSLVGDKVLNDFLSLYTDERELGNGETQEEYLVQIQDKENDQTAKITQQNAYDTKTRKELLKYVTFLKKSNNFKYIKLLDCGNLELETNSGRRVKIPEEHFNSLRIQTRSRYECIVCATTVKRRLKWEHLYEEGHVERITISFNDENCIRKIDTSWIHCAICNTKVHMQYQEGHKFDVTHKLYLSEALHLCNGYITLQTQKLEDFKQFTKTQTHASTLRALTCEDDPDIVHISKAKAVTHCGKSKNNVISCREDSDTSKSNESNTPSEQGASHEIKEPPHTNHTSGIQNITLFKEKQKVDQLTSLTNQVVLKREGTHIQDNNFYCALCKINIPNHNYNIYTHLFAPKHKEKTTQATEEELIYVHYHMSLTKYPQVECLVCKKTLSLKSSNITTHISGSPHQLNYKLMLSNNKIILNNTNLVCIICQTNIDPMQELLHCQCKKHVTKLPPTENDNSNVAKAPIIKDTPSKTNYVTQKEHNIKRIYLLENIEKNQPYCLVCNVKVPNTINNIKTHLAGRHHNDQYNIKLFNSRMRPDGFNFKCEFCNVIVYAGSELKHMETSDHVINSIDF